MDASRFSPQQHEAVKRAVIYAVWGGEELMFNVQETAPVWLSMSNVAPIVERSGRAEDVIRVQDGRLQVWGGMVGFVTATDFSVERFGVKYNAVGFEEAQ